MQLTLRLQLAYIPTPLIIDPTARDNYRDLELIARLGMRATGSIVLPEIGLGPLFRTGIDSILVHDLQRDFFITKLAAIPNISWRPVGEFQTTLFNSFEFNNSRIFQAGTSDAYIRSSSSRASTRPTSSASCSSRRRDLRVRAALLVSWDRRDNAFNASQRHVIVSGIEHVDAFPLGEPTSRVRARPDGEPLLQVHRDVRRLHPAARRRHPLRRAHPARREHAATATSATYPDRLFFMGGVDPMRGWNLNSFIPQDDVDRIFRRQGPAGHVVDPTTRVDDPEPGQVHREHEADPRRQPDDQRAPRAPHPDPWAVRDRRVRRHRQSLDRPAYPFAKGAFPIRGAVGTASACRRP